MHFRRPPAVHVGAVGAERCDLELQFVLQHHDDTEMGADGVSAREKLLHLFRPRVGRDVDILGRDAAKEIAHRTACIIGDVPGLAEPACN